MSSKGGQLAFSAWFWGFFFLIFIVWCFVMTKGDLL